MPTSNDGVRFAPGDVLFNYYDMKVGTVGPLDTADWFDFEQLDGTVKLLNGERVCSLGFAKSRGWLS